jgi:hypothetical protein
VTIGNKQTPTHSCMAEDIDVAFHTSDDNDNDDSDYDYTYDDDDCELDSAGVVPVVGLRGIDFGEGAPTLYAVQSKIPLLSFYRNLANVCLVDVNDDFYSATLTVISNNQAITAQIRFPSQSPFFPEVPPQFILQSAFRAPLLRMNIIYNCHPALLRERWNPCTDVASFVKEISEAAKEAIVDGIDDADSIPRALIDLFALHQVDISRK